MANPTPTRLAILGSTGSIGASTLDVVAHHSERFEVSVLVGGRRMERLAEQVRALRPRAVAVAEEEGARELREMLAGERDTPRIFVGAEGACEALEVGEPDCVMAAIVGAAGLLPTLAAVEKGLRVGLANKEALVVAGELMTDAAAKSGATLLPVDSEHNAVHQCLRAAHESELARIVLTASGGPFRGRSRAELEGVTRREALDHPTWDMGPKITIDSATLMNKGLEVIEAHWLFGLAPREIDVVVHPQSIVHSMVEFLDGSVVAQLGHPDMRHTIQYALTWPERIEAPLRRLRLAEVGSLDFEEPDKEAFPCLELAYLALEAGGDAPARLNAANEVAVQAFLDGEIAFLDIARLCEGVLSRESTGDASSLDALLQADADARRDAAALAQDLARAR